MIHIYLDLNKISNFWEKKNSVMFKPCVYDGGYLGFPIKKRTDI